LLNKDSVLKKIAGTKPFSYFGLIGFGLAILLSACGDSNALGLVRPDKPCVIVEYKPQATNGLGKPAPITLVLDRSSPEYCQNVKNDYKAAMVWYSSQVTNNSYAPTMDQELANYYTGEILGEARASLYYNKQAKRVVLGQFNPQALSFSDQTWTRDGLSSTLTVNPGDYSLSSFPEGKPNQAVVTERTKFESWVVTLIFDAKAGHWKISAAETVFTALGG
jgi:hypothetical protein